MRRRLMMESYWDDLDGEILGILKTAGPSDPASLARVLGMSTSAVCSCLAMLSAEGKVQIRSVEVSPQPLARVA